MLICLTVGVSGVFTSCKNDVQNIDYVHESKHVADFTQIIAAINSQTETLAYKIDLINASLASLNVTLDDKLAIIEAAITNGIGSYKEYATQLIAAIDQLNATQGEKLNAIYEILASNNATLAQKLADIEAAVKAGFGSYEELAQQLIDSINALNQSQQEKLQLIFDILNSGLASVQQKVADVEAAVKAGFLDNKTAIEALQNALVIELQNNKEDLSVRLGNLKDAITAIKGSLDYNFTFTAQTLKALTNELVKSLKDNQASTNKHIDEITVAIALLTGNVTVEYGKLIDLLKELVAAVEAGADYSEIIAAIKGLFPGPDPEPVPEGYVDLGLSVYWAECNLGAEESGNYGNYYGWGMVKPYEGVDFAAISWPLYFYKLGGKGDEEKDCGTGKDPLKDYLKGGGISGTPWDAAYMGSEGTSRIPTQDEFTELINNTDSEWVVNEQGIKGLKLSKGDKSIFFPAAGLNRFSEVSRCGYYMTATNASNSKNYYFGFKKDGDRINRAIYEGSRYKAISIRPVMDKK